MLVKGESVTREPVSSEAPVTITTPAAVVANLALTGSSVASLALLALMLIAVGLVLRRRSQSEQAAGSGGQQGK